MATTKKTPIKKTARKKKDGRKNNGGARPGAGKKLPAGENKKLTGFRIYPADKKKVIEKYGSIQAWINITIEALNAGSGSL